MNVYIYIYVHCIYYHILHVLHTYSVSVLHGSPDVKQAHEAHGTEQVGQKAPQIIFRI